MSVGSCLPVGKCNLECILNILEWNSYFYGFGFYMLQVSSAFICTIDSDVFDAQTECQTCMELYFTTDRSSLAYLLVGILKAIAMKLYHTQITVTIDPETEDNLYR